MQELEQKQTPKKSYLKIGAAITAIAAVFGIALYSTPNLLRGDLLPGDTVPEGFAIRSESFIDGDIIPIKHSCRAENNQFVSPGLQFFNVPEGTKSLFLEVFDIDANFRHWVVGNIPPTTQRIGENETIQAPAVEGVNNFNFRGYGPNCPPPFDGAHRYVYTLYALDVEQIDISAFDNGQARVRPQNVFGNNIIAETKITGLFEEQLLEGSTLACKENEEIIEENTASLADPQTGQEAQLPIQTKKITSTKTIALLNGPQKTRKNICSKTIESSKEAPFRAKTTEMCKQEIVNQTDGTCKITCQKAGFAFLFGLIGVPPIQEETFEGICDLDNSGSSDIEEINTILDDILGSELQASLFIHTVYAATNGNSAIEKDINLLNTLDLNNDTDRQRVEAIKADRQNTLDLLNKFVEAGFNFARLQEGIQKLNDHIAQLQEALDNPPEPEEKPEQPAPEENTPPEDSNQPEPPIVPTGGTDINQVIQNFIESKDDAATEEDCANVGNKRIGIIGGPGRLTTIHMAQRSITTFSTENGEVTSDGTPGEFQDVFGPQTLNRCNSESIVRQVGLDPNNFGDQKGRIKIGLVESTSSQSDTVEVLDFDPKTGLCTIARTFTSSSNVPDHETTRSGTISGRTIIEFAKGSTNTKRQISVTKGFCDLDGQRDIDIFKFHTFHIDSLPPAFASLKQLIALNKALEEINTLAQGTNNAAEITTLGKQKIEELKEAFEVIRQDTEKELRANKPFVQYNGPRAETEEEYEEIIAKRAEGKFSNFIGTLERTINTIERGNVGFGKRELASLLFKIQNTELQSTMTVFKTIFDLKILEDRFRGDVGEGFIQHFQSDSSDYIKRLQKTICSNTSAKLKEILKEIVTTEKTEQDQYIADVNAGTEDAVYAPSPLFGFVNVPNLNLMPFLAKIVDAIETGLDTCEVEEVVEEEQCSLDDQESFDEAVNEFKNLSAEEQNAIINGFISSTELKEGLQNAFEISEEQDEGKVLGVSTQLLAQANGIDQSPTKRAELIEKLTKGVKCFADVEKILSLLKSIDNCQISIEAHKKYRGTLLGAIPNAFAVDTPEIQAQLKEIENLEQQRKESIKKVSELKASIQNRNSAIEALALRLAEFRQQEFDTALKLGNNNFAFDTVESVVFSPKRRANKDILFFTENGTEIKQEEESKTDNKQVRLDQTINANNEAVQRIANLLSNNSISQQNFDNKLELDRLSAQVAGIIALIKDVKKEVEELQTSIDTENTFQIETLDKKDEKFDFIDELRATEFNIISKHIEEINARVDQMSAGNIAPCILRIAECGTVDFDSRLEIENLRILETKGDLKRIGFDDINDIAAFQTVTNIAQEFKNLEQNKRFVPGSLEEQDFCEESQKSLERAQEQIKNHTQRIEAKKSAQEQKKLADAAKISPEADQARIEELQEKNNTEGVEQRIKERIEQAKKNLEEFGFDSKLNKNVEEQKELRDLQNELREEQRNALDILERQFKDSIDTVKEAVEAVRAAETTEEKDQKIDQLKKELNIILSDEEKQTLKEQNEAIFEVIRNTSSAIEKVRDAINNPSARPQAFQKNRNNTVLISMMNIFIPSAHAETLCEECLDENTQQNLDDLQTILTENQHIVDTAEASIIQLKLIDVDTTQLEQDLNTLKENLENTQNDLNQLEQNVATCNERVSQERATGECVDTLPVTPTNACSSLEQDAQQFADEENNGVLTPEDKAMICICRSENNLDLGEFCPEAPTQQTPEEDIPTPPPAGEQTPEEDVSTPPPAGEQTPEEDVPTPPPAGEETPEEDSQVSEEEVEIENIAGPRLLDAFDNDGDVNKKDFVAVFESYKDDTQAGLDAVKENVDGQLDAKDFEVFQQNFNQGTPQSIQDFENALNTANNAFKESSKTSEKLRDVVEAANQIQKLIPSNQQSDPQIQQKIIDILSPALDQFTNDRINNTDFKVPLIESLIETPLEDFFTSPETEGTISIIEKFIGKASAQQLPSCPSCNTFDQILDEILSDLENIKDIKIALQEIINSLQANGVNIDSLRQKLDQIELIAGNLGEIGIAIEVIQNECQNQVAQLKNDQLCTDQKKGGRIITDARCDQNCNIDLIRVNRQRIETTLRDLSSNLKLLFTEISNEESDITNIQANIRSVSQLIDNIENGYKQYTASFTEKTVLSCIQNKYNAMSDGLCFGENRCNACEEINNFYKIFVNESREYKAITSDILKSFVTVVDAVRSNDELQPQLQQYMNTTENLINTLIPTLTLRKETREQMKESWEACNAEVDTLTELNQCTVDGI